MYAEHVTKKQTPQSEPIPGAKQIKNNAGGYVFEIDPWTRLRRFLILGSEKGSYYQSERDLTIDNAQSIVALIKSDGPKVVKETVSVSVQGYAPKNDPAIFIMALASVEGDDKTRSLVYENLDKVCRIGTHLFQFVGMRDKLGGWGRGVKRAVNHWYLSKPIDNLAYQLAKYQQRNGWSHRDVLRLTHPKDEQRNALFRWAVGKGESSHYLIEAMEIAHHESTPKNRIVELIASHGLTREMIPTDRLSDPDIQRALIQKQGLTALIRNLGNYSKSGLLKPLSEAASFVASRLTEEEIHKARVHPLSILIALKTYARGQGIRGSGSWTPVPQVIDALDQAFYLAFKNVEPTGLNYLLGVDVSGSMGLGDEIVTPREAAAAMALVTSKTENTYVHGFSTTFVDLGFSRLSRLDDAIEKTSRLPFSGTDCAIPMLWATENKVKADIFIVYTDNDTWSGPIHPKQALDQYRQKMGIPAKLIVCAFTATRFSIADPDDLGMLDIAGLDAGLPQVIREFSMM